MFLIWNSKNKLWSYFSYSDTPSRLGDTMYRMTYDVKTRDGYGMESYNLWTTWTTRTTGNWISGVFVPNIKYQTVCYGTRLEESWDLNTKHASVNQYHSIMAEENGVLKIGIYLLHLK